MSQSLQEYHVCWQQAMQQLNVSQIVEDLELTDESCVIFETAHSTPMGEGMTTLPDFGDAICYYRYYRAPDELEPHEHSTNEDVILSVGLEILQRRWEHRRPKLSDDEIQARRVAAEQALDALLEEFVKQGYQSEMSNRLREIIKRSLIDFEILNVMCSQGIWKHCSRLSAIRSLITIHMRMTKKLSLRLLLST